MDYTLLNLEALLRKIGRGSVWYAHDGTGPTDIGDPIRWDRDTELQLAQISDTEGDIVFNPNAEIAQLTLPETRGAAIFEATAVGGAPELQVPLFMADADLLALLSETGQASMGHSRVRDIEGFTVVVFPERLFRKADNTYATLSVSGGAFLLDGVALDAAHTSLLGHSLWLWNAIVQRPETTFRGGHGDDGKNIETVTIRPKVHPLMPEGHQLYTRGNPFDFSIDLEGGS